MPLFRTQTQFEVWQEHWCRRCFEPNEAQRRLQGKQTMCPILARAIAYDRKPKEWHRNNKPQEIKSTYRCNSFQAKPPNADPRKRGASSDAPEDEPLFDITPYKVDVGFVPVDGWPDRPKKGKDVDHA